jgi:hypothetical protein
LVGVDDRRVFVPDLVGLAYLAELVRQPGRPVAALTLAAGEAVPEPGPQDVLDDRARAAYGARLRDLGDELAEAEAGADRARAERLRLELDALLDHLEEATGLHGRSRAFTHQAERARTAVRKAIKRALDLIDGLDPVVAEALRTTVTTGATCVYVPDRAAPVTWST